MTDLEPGRPVSLVKELDPAAFVESTTTAVVQQSNGQIILAWIVTGLTGFYMLPWAVAASRRSTRSIEIAIATSLLAWTGIGWLVLLVLAFLGPTVRSDSATTTRAA